MSLSRKWPGWIVLLSLGLAPTGDTSCLAADPPPPPSQATAAGVPPALPKANPKLADPSAKRVEPTAKPAKLLTKAALVKSGSGTLVLSGSNTYTGGTLVWTAEPAAKPAAPAAKPGSLLGTIVEALGSDRDANKRPAQAVGVQNIRNLRQIQVNPSVTTLTLNARNVQQLEDQNIRNLMAQFRPQFQQLLYGELAFLRRVCKPEAKPFSEIAKAARASVEAPLREYVVTRFVRRQPTPRGVNGDDPRSDMQRMLAPLVKEKLGPEKAQLYLQECNKRTEARKHAVVVNLVAMLDERLALTALQRGKLMQSLSANYEDSWDQFFEVFGIGGQNLPTVRDESIVSLLDDDQKRVWGQTEKQNRVYISGRIVRDFMQGGAPEIQEIAHIAEEGQK